ncbi:isochorismatase family protein [Tateyamaria armeniaca]|uniref:Isochorismatase family protein n=1 Tax=Tateyamaria armeniaca TaxID=2518930 RepID=A0ABW8UYH1_9RHOB
MIKAEFDEADNIARHIPSAKRSGDFANWATARRDEGRSKIVLGGISLDNCTMQTTLDLLAEEFEVYVVVDVYGAESSLVEHSALLRLVQAGATPINWTQFACEVMDDWETEEGPAIGGLLSEHSRYGALGVPGGQPSDT